ncbi:hypothetical protein ACEWY4_005775 [Coilia grayii]|uniref:Ig-like domain-containing protein n=1 Tax=Coilia grayii TaxID=363190 RepID=A0ABD1KJC4_9TELE
MQSHLMSVLLLLLWQSICCVRAIQVSQNPPDLVLRPGSPLTVNCTIAGVTSPYLYWYRWTATGGIELKFLSVGTGMMDPEDGWNGFKASRPVDLQLTLESTKVQQAEPAVWYCAASDHSVRAIQVSQNPPDLVLRPGSPLTVNCTIAGVSNPNLYWYRWIATGVIELKFYSVAIGAMDPGEVDGFKASRPVDLQLTLESTKVQQAEPAVWYCAASRHSVRAIQVSQNPPDLVLRPGSPLRIDCTIAGVTSPDLFWYRWSATGGTELKFYSAAVGAMDPGEVDGFKASRPVDLQLTLESTKVQQAEPAVWYCAASVRAIQVSQNPADLVLRPGSPLTVNCTIAGVTSPYLYWYRWTATGGIELKFYSVGTGMMDPKDGWNGFKASRPVDLQLTLESTKVQQAEPAVCFVPVLAAVVRCRAVRQVLRAQQDCSHHILP